MNTPKLIKGLRMPWALTTTSRRTQRSRAKQQHLNAEHGAALATEDALAAKRRAGKKKRTNDAQSKAAVQWHCERKSPRASHLGYYDPAAPGVLSSTRQMEFSHMAIASPPTSHRGLAFGIDAGSGWMVVHDPFTSYGNELESPNVCFIGDLGQGKSSGIKTWAVLRQLLLGRRVVVIDKKYQLDQNGGEYTSLAQRLGITPVKFMVGGGGARINILDPRIAARLNEDSHDDTALSTPAGQSMLVRAVVEEALGRPLLPKEGKAVRMAHKQALRTAAANHEIAHIRHVLSALYAPDADAATASNLSVEEIRQWGQDPAFELERMIEDDLAGLIDGPTSEEISLNAGLTVFDVSLLPEDGPALAIVMTIINTWLANTLYRQSEAVPTVLVIEEAWHTVQGSVAKVTRRNTKLSRALSLSCMFAFHHISDIPEDSPAIAMLKECGTVLLYKQQKSDDAWACERMFNLPAGSAADIASLTKGTCMMRIGGKDPFIAIHVRSALEIELTDTDKAMKSTATINQVEADTREEAA
ncbi:MULTISPECIES: ATP/GTP-binding protein [Pseudarthrobacter]|uniref:ATP/GTP-binding protein n=1 Tax=Pseudarthrobacter TaxID=1742993 RepID=UPI000CEC83E5